MQYNFEWDPEKAQSNRRKHALASSRPPVCCVIRALSVYDREHSDAEDRWVTLGLSAAGGLLVVHHTFEEVDPSTIRIRIFSSRKATKRETKQYSE